MGRRSPAVVASLVALVALANCFAFAYATDQRRLGWGLSHELQAEIERACFGLIPPDVAPDIITIIPERPACMDGDPVYESLYVNIRLTPGLWIIEVARFYSRTRHPLSVSIVTEVPLRLIASEVYMMGGGWIVELPLDGNSSRVLHLPPGESVVRIALRVRAVVPTSEPFRVGFHIATAG